MIGKTISHYQILDKLGQGGMGEVYRARDIRLERDVAVKVLPSHLAEDPSALARFEREAKAVAALSHPNILAVFDVGREGPTAYLVMELLEGATLREQVANGALPSRKVIDYGVQIAEGLAAAHDKGFVHRDLKPDNLFLTAEGRVKILDFGLAKEVARVAQTSESPTMGTATAPGVIMGTVGYMAPEQVRGQAADQRADLFALGAVLHELLTGRAPFGRETPAETMTAILREDPPELTEVDTKIPVGLARLVQHCLEKNPSERFQSARDLVFSLKTLSSETPSSGMSVPGMAAPRAFSKLAGWWSLVWVAGAVALLALGVIVGAHWLAPPPGPDRATILDVALPADVEVEYPSAAFSSDGSQFVFGGNDKRGTGLWLRSLSSATNVRLPGTEGADNTQRPIWSPDSRYLLFSADRKIKRIELASGTVETVWTEPSELTSAEPAFFAGDWNDQGDILFSWVDLFRLRGSGGKPEPIAARQPDDVDLIAGRWLPDGRHYVFHAKNRTSGRGSVFVGTLGSSERVSVLASDSPATYVDPGYLLFIQSGGLFAQRFDAGRLKLEGQPVQLVGGVEASSWGWESQWASNGTAAFARGRTVRGQLTWFDRSGRETGRVGEPLDILSFDLSRDGTRVAASVGAYRRARLRLIDTTRAQSPVVWLTDGPQDYDPRFNSEGDAVIFASQDQRGQGLFRLSIHDTTPVPILIRPIEEIYKTGVRLNFHDWSRDGRLVLYGTSWRGGWLLRVAPIADTSRTQAAVEQVGFSDEARFSPDGRWMAYNNPESGTSSVAPATYLVFVSPFPPRGEPQRITTHGGVQPIWRADGRELYYLDPAGNLMAVDVAHTSPAFIAGPPRLLFHTGLRSVSPEVEDYAVTADGQRFLVKLPLEGEAQAGYTIILNWPALLGGTK